MARAMSSSDLARRLLASARLIHEFPASGIQRYAGGDGILRFATEILNARLTPYQAEILHAFVEKRRIAVRAPHGAGKTALASIAVLWGVTTAPTDCKVITTASSWRQVRHFLWSEIRLWANRGMITGGWRKLGIEIRYGKELLEVQLKLGSRMAFGVASDNPALIEGAHAARIMYVFDEAKAIPDGIWNAAEGAFSAGGLADAAGMHEAYALAISTPGATSGRFYEICTRKPGFEDWATRHIRLEEAIAAGRISQTWADARAAQWGRSSAVYKNRVEGEFDDSGEDAVVPLRWIELANDRWRERQEQPRPAVLPIYGVDPAYKGEDSTTICKLIGSFCEYIKAYSKQEPMETAGRLASIASKDDPIAIDPIGIGAGIYSRLRELGYKVAAINAAESTTMKDKTNTTGFVNVRAALWWAVREALDPAGDDPLALPPEDKLTGDLTAPRWWYRSDGKIQIESKDDLRQRLGRSTDYADALAMAIYLKRFALRSLNIW